MAAQKSDTVGRAERLLQRLVELRARERTGYPPTLGRLLDEAIPEANSEERIVALRHRSFKERAIVVQKGDQRYPVAFLEDLERLATSPILLEQLLDAVCTPAKRVWELAKLKAKLSAVPAKWTAELRQAYERGVQQRVDNGALPESVGSVRVKDQTALYLKRLAPEPTAVQLAETLVRTLEQLRGQGSTAYPTTLAQLIEATGVEALPALWQKAAARREFKAKVVPAVKKEPESPLVFAGDLEQLAADRRVLGLAMQAERLGPRRVASLVDLAKHLVPALRKPFQQAVHRLLAREMLPREVNVVWHKLTPLLLPARPEGANLASAESSNESSARSPALKSDDAETFARAFDEVRAPPCPSNPGETHA